jgi:hypothetical protein
MTLFVKILFFLSIGLFGFSQNCPTIDFRNNGNGQPNSCPNVNGTPMASNFNGTYYATAFTGLSKTGNIRFIFSGTESAPPAIRKIWIGTTLSNVVAGPASVPEFVSGTTKVSYCFYGQNLPASGFYTLEFVNPQTNEVYSVCGFNATTNASANPPLITSQPQSQSVCEGNTLTITIAAQAAYGGSLSYQWIKDGNQISGATSATYVKTSVTTADEGNYKCLVAESTGTFILSNIAAIDVINCSSNTYMDACGSGALVSTATNSWTSAWVDYDNDGWEDIYVCDKTETSINKLYKNNSNSNFTFTSSSALSSVASKAVNSAWADYNRDGLKDVYISNATGDPGFLYKNVGGGNFQLMNNVGLDADAQYAHGAAWCDFDLDGYADLIVTNFFETRFHQLYRNNGNGSFTKIENSAISQEANRSMAPILCDYDKDGYTDVFIPNGNNKPNSLFRNLGNFQFSKVTTGTIATDAFNSVGATWGDYDSDGWPDLFVCNASGQNNNLYKNNGNGSFSSVTGTVLVEDGGHSHGANWIDIDNDADLDLFVTNDQGPNFLYINEGSGSFTRVMDEAIATDLGSECGQAWADHNKDGWLDLMMSTHSGQTDLLYCGKNNGKHWINIKLVGVISNPEALGARISILSGGIWQYRQNLPISGFGSQNSFRQHFGLNAATSIDQIKVEWPSGYVQTVSNITADQFITLTEEPSNLITGFSFDDANNNCVWDAGETKIEGIPFTLNPTNIDFSTGQNGNYQLAAPAGTYSINIGTNAFWNMSCGINFTLTGNDSTLYMNLPLTKNVSGYDLQISGGNTAWRRGFTGESVIQVSNIATTDAINARIEMTYPSGIELVSASIPWDEQIGSTYIWYIDTVKAGESFNITLQEYVSLNVSVGDELTLNSLTAADGTDLNVSNNNYEFTSEIVGAIDPNDILVTPKGKSAEGFIPRDQELRYHIRFQNVGTYYASRVVLENQLSKYLDWKTFKIVSVSHPNYNYSIDEKGRLIVKFENIELPDSTRNSEGSHGFFIYTIKAKSDVRGGARIENSVLISFDYEDPVKVIQS